MVIRGAGIEDEPGRSENLQGDPKTIEVNLHEAAVAATESGLPPATAPSVPLRRSPGRPSDPEAVTRVMPSVPRELRTVKWVDGTRKNSSGSTGRVPVPAPDLEYAESSVPTIVPRLDWPTRVDETASDESEPTSRAEARRGRREPVKSSELAVISYGPPVGQDSDGGEKRHLLATPWIKWGSVAAAVVLVVGAGVGVNAAANSDAPVAVPSRSVPAPDKPSATEPEPTLEAEEAPLGEGIGEDALALGDEFGLFPEDEFDELFDESEDSEEDEDEEEGDISGITIGPIQRPTKPPVTTTPPVTPPTVPVVPTLPPNPPGDNRPTVINKGTMTMDQVASGGSKVWRLTIRGISSRTALTISSTSALTLSYPPPSTITYQYVTPVTVGSGQVVWTIDTYNRQSNAYQTQTFTTH